jgi:hypothetical protein
VKYQGRKSAKTVNTLVLCDNGYNILAVSDGIDGNHHDSFEIVENFQKMIDSMDKQQIDYNNSHLNADSGFDVKLFLKFVEDQRLIPNIKQNKRNTKKKDLMYRYMSDYIYQSRFKVEVVFAWFDTYKRLLVRFELLALNFKSWLLMASALINFRTVFN